MLTRKPRFPIKDILLFGLWPSFVKRSLYRLRGYRIGKGVSIGFGSVICGEEVAIGDHTEIGFFSFLRGKRIKLGKRISIGSATMIDTPIVKIGDGTKINEQVFVGGLQDPDSRITIGRNCQIMQMTFINPAKWITIGDDTGIGGDSLVFGHTTWLSKFEGYPADFKPIEIGSSVSIAWRVFVGAGAKIGDGAVIGANSLVTRSIPEKCLATGSPAKVIAKAPYFPRDVSEDDKVRYLREILREMIGYLRGNGIECRQGEDFKTIAVRYDKKGWLSSRSLDAELHVEFDTDGEGNYDLGDTNFDAFLSLKGIPDRNRDELNRRGIVWLDIENKERADRDCELASEVTQYIRRYGVRFIRVPADN